MLLEVNLHNPRGIPSSDIGRCKHRQGTAGPRTGLGGTATAALFLATRDPARPPAPIYQQRRTCLNFKNPNGFLHSQFFKSPTVFKLYPFPSFPPPSGHPIAAWTLHHITGGRPTSRLGQRTLGRSFEKYSFSLRLGLYNGKAVVTPGTSK